MAAPLHMIGRDSVQLPAGAKAALAQLALAAQNATLTYRSAVASMALAHGFNAFAYDPKTGTISEPATDEVQPDQSEAQAGAVMPPKGKS